MAVCWGMCVLYLWQLNPYQTYTCSKYKQHICSQLSAHLCSRNVLFFSLLVVPSSHYMLQRAADVSIFISVITNESLLSADLSFCSVDNTTFHFLRKHEVTGEESVFVGEQETQKGKG